MIRIALIGCGNAGSYAAVSSRLRRAAFSAAADADPTTARQALGARVDGASLDDLLARRSDSFDAVVIDTPAQTHAELAIKAAEAGKHVLVEPPLALSTADADAAIAAARSSGARLMAGNPARFAPAGQTARNSLDSGELGEPGLLRVHRWEPPSVTSQPLIEGSLAQDLDLAIWLFEGTPTEVYATARNISGHGSDRPDYAQIHLGFPGGGMSIIDYSDGLPMGPGYHFLSLIGSRGAAYADDHHDVNLVYGGGNAQSLDADRGRLHLLAQLQEFVDAIEDDREPSVTGADGRAAVETAVAAMESIASGRAARLEGGRYELV